MDGLQTKIILGQANSAVGIRKLTALSFTLDNAGEEMWLQGSLKEMIRLWESAKLAKFVLLTYSAKVALYVYHCLFDSKN